MSKPIISDDPLYLLLRDGKVAEFNKRIAAGEKAVLSCCDFRHTDLRGLEAKGIDFSNAYFRQADLRGIDFLDCDNIEGASFHAAKISGARFPPVLKAEEIMLSLQFGTRVRYQ